jgi:tetratricopeptide (TPR) repeat protein
VLGSDPDVSICITAYKSGRMIEPTLRSVAAQTYPDFRVLISLDGPHEETEAICRAQRDPRFSLIVQPDRLGWVSNTNALLDRVTTRFFFILPHDDLLHERYIEALRAELLAHPEAVNAYSDVEQFGAERRTSTKPGLDGEFPARVGAFLNPRSTSWIPWRGLTRSAVLAEGLRMRDNEHGGFESHLGYILALLCLGPFRRVAETLYYSRDRADENAVRTVFRARTAGARYAAALQHVVEAIDTVSRIGVTEKTDMRERRMAVEMLLIEFATRDIFSELHASTAHSGFQSLAAVAGDILARIHGLPLIDDNSREQPRRGSEFERMTARLHVVEGHAAIARGNLASAETAIASALDLDPLSGEAHWQKGVLLKCLGQIPQAIFELRRARELIPENSHLPLLLADLLEQTGDIEGAIAEARAATTLRGGRGRVYHRLARYLERGGRQSEALEAARLASEINPGRFRSHYETMLRKSAAGGAEGELRSAEKGAAPALSERP